jgi:hypothetical protein
MTQKSLNFIVAYTSQLLIQFQPHVCVFVLCFIFFFMIFMIYF